MQGPWSYSQRCSVQERLDRSNTYRVWRCRSQRPAVTALPVMISRQVISTDRSRVAFRSHSIFIEQARLFPAVSRRPIDLPSMWTNRRGLLPSSAQALVVVDENDHPNADLAVAADQRSAMNPPVASIFIGSRDPSDLRRYSTAFGKRRHKFVANT